MICALQKREARRVQKSQGERKVESWCKMSLEGFEVQGWGELESLRAIQQAIPDWHEEARGTEFLANLLRLRELPDRLPVEGPFFVWEGARFTEQVGAGAGLGGRASEAFRKWVSACYWADLASYPETSNQVSFARLLWALQHFPQGFSVWFARIREPWNEHRAWMPVGYSGWFPISAQTFDGLVRDDASARRRQRHHHAHDHQPLPPPMEQRPHSPELQAWKEPGRDLHLYLFNYSLVGPLRKTALSCAFMRHFAAQLAQVQAEQEKVKAARRGGRVGVNLVCCSVSEDGDRIAGRFGLKLRAQHLLQGKVNRVFASGVQARSARF